MNILKTNSENQDFVQLVKMLDEYLAFMDGEDHAFYDQFNKIDLLNHCVVLYEGENPVGCGAIKPYDEESAELKRMFVIPEFRGKGYASKIMEILESWAKDLGFGSMILETGIQQTDAIQLYQKTYQPIENYGQYEGVATSVCFKKAL